MLAVAIMLDRLATKLAVVQQRAESREDLDVAARLHTGLDLAAELGAAGALSGGRFNPMITLKALAFG